MCTTSQRAPKYSLIWNHQGCEQLDKSAFSLLLIFLHLRLHLFFTSFDPITLSFNPSFSLIITRKKMLKIKTEKEKNSLLFNDVNFEHLIYYACMCAVVVPL